MKKTIIAAIMVWLTPLLSLLGVAVLINPTVPNTTHCSPTSNTVGSPVGITLDIPVTGSIPDTLTAKTTDGTTVTVNRVQLTRAATIITVGGKTVGVGRKGIVVALMAALAESGLRMLANRAAYPGSASYPNDGDGSDHDSLGMFQLRPQTGWGTVAQLMDPTYQAAAFYGGPSGPTHGSPRGLLDVPGWQTLPLGAAAQTVEGSAFPNRYTMYEPVARTILITLTGSSTTTDGSGCAVSGDARQLAQTLMDAYRAGTFTDVNPEMITKEIQPLAGGVDVPGCQVDTRILQVLVRTLWRFGSIGISDLGRPCVGSTLNCPSSPHCTIPDRAVDFTGVGGRGLDGSNAADIQLLTFLDSILPDGSYAGQSNCRTITGNSLTLRQITQFPDSCNHQHIDIRNIGDQSLKF